MVGHGCLRPERTWTTKEVEGFRIPPTHIHTYWKLIVDIVSMHNPEGDQRTLGMKILKKKRRYNFE